MRIYETDKNPKFKRLALAVWYASLIFVGSVASFITLKVTSEPNSENAKLIPLFLALSIVGGIADIVLIWKLINTPKIGFKALSFEEKLARDFAQEMPPCKESKFYSVVILAWIIPIIALLVALAFAETRNLRIILLCVLGVVFVGGAIGVALFMRRFSRKNDEHYAQIFPFDFDDISKRENLSKSVRAEWLKREAVFKKYYPEIYGGNLGNGYWIKFTEKGIVASSELPKVTPEDDFVNYDVGYRQNIVLELTYEQLNLQAIAFLRLNTFRPISAIVRSRLDRSEIDLPDKFVDFYFPLSAKLLENIRKYNVPVENLDYILENKEKLIRENKKEATYPRDFNGTDEYTENVYVYKKN